MNTTTRHGHSVRTSGLAGGSGETRMHRFLQTLGPGLLWAGAAIGVSHLVQSTRAGASAGFSLAWVVVAALILKYPFFEYGPRYAAATGESLVEGYYRLGRWAVWTFVAITVATALIVQVAVSLFTAFVFANALGLDWPVAVVGAVILTGCAALLAIGRYRALDLTIKVVLVVLTICTLVAAAVTIPRAGGAAATPWPAGGTIDLVPFAFILALVGWMPSAIDISVWSSLWTLAKNRSAGVQTSVGEALLDFRIGYVGTGIIALAFMTLGAGLMHTAGQQFSPVGSIFSMQLVDLYATTLGEWARPVVLAAVLTTMFSTTLTVMDGFPRAIARSFSALRYGIDEPSVLEREERVYWAALAVLAVLTVLVFHYFVGNMTTMMDFATTVSFITAPILGYLNLRAVTAAHVPEAFRPGRRMLVFSYAGLTALGLTALLFLGHRLIA
jgi:Mn2+/Fe2+ NRAMP family transporter